MAEALAELLLPETSPQPPPGRVTDDYLNRLSTLPLSSLTSTEPESLSQSTHSNLLNLQRLSARSNAALVTSSKYLGTLRKDLPRLARQAQSLRSDISGLDGRAVSFAEKYSRNNENEVLDRRKKSLLMARNVDRLADMLDLPNLLSSAISSSSSSAGQAVSSTAGNYASALDLYSHIRRLHLLFQDSRLVDSIYSQTEDAMLGMTASLINSLRSQNLKLAVAMRTIGWLRRVAPEMGGSSATTTTTMTQTGNQEGILGALFLSCRLSTLRTMIAALDPLRDLADQETTARIRGVRSKTATATATTSNDGWAGGQQTERFLKRYLEIFREQSFAIISMYRSIFPAAPDVNATTTSMDSLPAKLRPGGFTRSNHQDGGTSVSANEGGDIFKPSPSALATFPDHLVSMLMTTLREYLPNVRDKSSRESLLTQVLYCAGSLGRLGGDFSLLLATLSVGRGGVAGANGTTNDDEEAEDEEEDEEWVMVMKKHRVLAGRLEKLASGAA